MSNIPLQLCHYIAELIDIIDHHPDRLHSLFASKPSSSYFSQAVAYLDLLQHAKDEALQGCLLRSRRSDSTLKANPPLPCFYETIIHHIGENHSLSQAVHTLWTESLVDCEIARIITTDTHGHLAQGLAQLSSPSTLAHVSAFPERFLEGLSADRFPIAFASLIHPSDHLKPKFVRSCYSADYCDAVGARLMKALARVLGPDLSGLGRLIQGVPLAKPDPRRCQRISALIVSSRQPAFVVNQLIEFSLGMPATIDTSSVLQLLKDPWASSFALEIVSDSRFRPDPASALPLCDAVSAALFIELQRNDESSSPCCSWRGERHDLWAQLRPEAVDVLNAERRLLRCCPHLGDRIGQCVLHLLDVCKSPNLALAVARAILELTASSIIRDRIWFVSSYLVEFVDDGGLVEALSAIASIFDQIDNAPSDSYVDAALRRLLASRGSLFGHLAEHVYELKERYEPVAVHCLECDEFYTKLIALLSSEPDPRLIANSATLLGVMIHDIVSKRVAVDGRVIRRIARANLVPTCCKRFLAVTDSDMIDMVRSLLDCICIAAHLNETEISSYLFGKSATAPPLLMQILEVCGSTPFRGDRQLLSNQRSLVVTACRNLDSRFVITLSKSPDACALLQGLFDDLQNPVNSSDLSFLQELCNFEPIVAQLRRIPGLRRWLTSSDGNSLDTDQQAAIGYFVATLRL